MKKFNIKNLKNIRRWERGRWCWPDIPAYCVAVGVPARIIKRDYSSPEEMDQCTDFMLDLRPSEQRSTRAVTQTQLERGMSDTGSPQRPACVWENVSDSCDPQAAGPRAIPSYRADCRP